MVNPPPASLHVFLVVEENHSYSQVIGNSSMPYLNGLASKYGRVANHLGIAVILFNHQKDVAR
jgi:acid phosphatase